ncbi:ATP-binding protein [Anatilimnocola sp. NA78]|uniref:ATP-binding protein n=1 Tax=Anatilimnocola sp. NA78 TaxID=3415683 RepID=UPI003CE4A72A
MSETAEQFSKLTDREHVRLRPGMYIGNVDQQGLHHLAGELINNSVDEVLAGHATQISVTIHSDGSLSVEDDGRGISVDRHEEESTRLGREISTLEVAMTILRRIKSSNQRRTSGVGLKAVNFLSQSCVTTVWRDGFEYQLRFAKGEVVGDLARLGQTSKHGTRVTFHADPEIFECGAKFEYHRLQTRLCELAYLHPRLIAKIHDERTQELHFEQGIGQLVQDLNWGRQSPTKWCSRYPVHTNVLRLEAEGKGTQLELALQFTIAESELIQTYVNDELMPEGGTPAIGLRRGITRAVHNYAKKMNFQSDDFPTGSDLRSGLTAVIMARLDDPRFAGATRHKIENPELNPLTDSAVYTFLQQHFVAHPETFDKIWHQGVVAARRRKREDQGMSS